VFHGKSTKNRSICANLPGGLLALLAFKINNAYNRLHDPKWVKKNATPSLLIVHNYVSALTTNKPDPTPCTVKYSLGVVPCDGLPWRVNGSGGPGKLSNFLASIYVAGQPGSTMKCYVKLGARQLSG